VKMETAESDEIAFRYHNLAHEVVGSAVFFKEKGDEAVVQEAYELAAGLYERAHEKFGKQGGTISLALAVVCYRRAGLEETAERIEREGGFMLGKYEGLPLGDISPLETIH